jgi:hypothetical protein
MNANGQLLESLTDSEMFKNYERAYSEATNLPISMRPLDMATSVSRQAQGERLVRLDGRPVRHLRRVPANAGKTRAIWRRGPGCGDMHLRIV